MAEAPLSDTALDATPHWSCLRPLDRKETFWNLTRAGRRRRRSQQGDSSPTSLTHAPRRNRAEGAMGTP